MADALSWLQQMLGGGQGAQPGGDAFGQLQSRLASEDQVQTPPQTWPWDLSRLTGMPSALEQSAAATAANPWQPGMTAGQVLAGRPEDPLASSFYPGVGVGAIKAYHGSPYDFERFDLSKIGTGEGAQAYGHGLYFAEHEPVARGYRDALAKPMQMNDPVGNAWDLLNKGGFSKTELLDQFNQMAKAFPDKDFWQSSIEAIKSGAVDRYKPPGHMYEVQIDAEPEHFLDWDKPLSQQSEKVREFLSSHPAVASSMEGQAPILGDRARDPTGQAAYAALTGWRRGVDLSPPPDAAAAATNRLREAGIPGIRYLDQGSRGAGDGTHNYAVWMPELITIMRRYGILPPLAAGAAAGGGLLGAGSEPPT